MRVSLFRNRVWIAFLLIALTYLALDFWRPGDAYVRAGVIIVAAVVLAQLIAWIFSLLLAKRIRGLNSFTERLLDAPLSGDELPEADDELGILNQSLHRMSTRIRDLVGTLSLESNRRESILASMVEGVLAVDNRLQVIFCNDPLARVLGARPPVEEGTPVLDLVRDPALVNLLTQVIASGESVKHKIQLSSGGREVVRGAGRTPGHAGAPRRHCHPA
jgi:PAS domain-containing protein